MTSKPLPGTPEWAALMTASKVAGALGLSPWESPYAMWLMMRGDIPWTEQNRHMERGNRLENAVLDWWLADHPDHVEVARQQWYPLDAWAGATPDMDVTNEAGELELVDAKTIGRDDHFADGPPPHYLVSSLWQLACTPKAQRVHLAVLFGSPFDLRHFTVERAGNEAIIASLIDRCREFWLSLAHDEPPALDDTVATFEAVKALHPDIDRDAQVELDPTIAVEYVEASLALKAAEDRDRAARSALLEQMGQARIATCQGIKIARRQPNKYGVSVVRTTEDAPTQTQESAA